MGEGKNKKLASKSSYKKLDIIIEKLLNNDEFLSEIAEKISKEYLENKDKCNKMQKFDIKNIEKKEKFLNEEISASYCEKYNVDEYINEINQKSTQIENLKMEKIQLSQKIEELICINNGLLEEKSNLVEEVNSLESTLDNTIKKNTELIYMKDKEIIDLKNKQGVMQNQLHELKKENECLNKELTISKNKYYEIEENIKQISKIKEKELRNKEKELNYKDKVILQKQLEINNLQCEFLSMKKSYNLFLSLNDEIKNDMISILRGDKIENFVYAGVQYKNIESIWEYAKNRAINGKFEDLDKLQNIIINFLDAYNMIYNSPLYEVQKVENGDDFDEERFIRGYKSRITGVISGVDLLGYVNLVNDKIIKKSVVRI